MSFVNQPETFETMEGTSTDGDWELTVTYEVHCWSEGQAYGNTTAYQRHCECEPLEFQLDGEIRPYAYLLKIFGEKRLEEMINRAME